MNKKGLLWFSKSVILKLILLIDTWDIWSTLKLVYTTQHLLFKLGHGSLIINGNYIPEKTMTIVTYRKTSNISHTLVGNKIADNSDVVGASPVGAAPATFSFST